MGTSYCPHCFSWDPTDRADNSLVDDSAPVFWQHCKDAHPLLWEQIKDTPMRWMADE